MADGGKKAAKALYYIGITLALIGYGFFGYLKLTDTEIYFYSRLFNCYTICFAAVLMYMIVRVWMVFRKNGGKFNYQLWLMVIAAVVTVACFINSLAEDLSESKNLEIVNVNENTDIFLCETDVEKDHSRIDVYCCKGILTRKIGEIDERLFSVKCLEAGNYQCNVSEDGTTVTVICFYGTYGDGIYELNPAYDTGTLTYTFGLDQG